MNLSEKIQYLRKENHYTQEELAELCHVSRQAITKWEADLAIPETDKLILLSQLFQVTVDSLLKDDLSVQGIRTLHSCGKNIAGEYQNSLYEGVLIKESISDEHVIDLLQVNKVELWRTDCIPTYWTALYFTSSRFDFPAQVAKALRANDPETGNWFVDFKRGDLKYVVFHDLVLSYHIGNLEEKAIVCNRCRELGIPDDQMQWSE